jgi:hypothetical protein
MYRGRDLHKAAVLEEFGHEYTNLYLKLFLKAMNNRVCTHKIVCLGEPDQCLGLSRPEQVVYPFQHRFGRDPLGFDCTATTRSVP